MENESDSLTADQADELFEVRDKLETLTKQFVDSLVSSKQEADTNAKLLHAILNSIGDGVIVFGKDERIILVNRAAANHAGWNMQQLTRSEFIRLYDLYKEDGVTLIPDEEQPFHIALNERRSARCEGKVFGPRLPKDGVWLRSVAAPVIDNEGELKGVVTVFSDITERKELQAQRDSLATLITHDLKNHLAAESMLLELFHDQFADKLAADELTLLSELKQSNQRYLDIASTLLEIHRTDMFGVQASRTSIPIGELINKVMALDAHFASMRQVELRITGKDEEATVLGIPTALQQVIHNLLQNAIFASEPGSAVEIRVNRDTSWVTIEIEDTGAGIEDDKISSLFNSTVPIKPLPNNPNSSSFGLYLSRKLVEHHGGKINCQSTLGRGTTFTVDLPIAKTN